MKRNISFIVIALFALTVISTSNTLAQQKDRAQIKQEIDALNQQMKQKEAELLAPSKKAQQTFAEFLKQPDTGLIRLLPRDRNDNNLKIRGGGAYYSFVRKTHEYGYGSDIELQQKYFSVGFAGADYGFLLDLGDVPIEDASLETNGIKYLAEYVPSEKEKDARETHQKLGYGIEADQQTYRSRVPAKVGDTYIVRSISFGGSDCLVAFKVVDEDFDGSMTIVWKMLKTFPKPALARTVER
jgi:hypothetical protein